MIYFPNILSNIEIYLMDPIIKYINPQNLRFFEICAMLAVQCPNHYITITLIFAPSIFAQPIFGGPNVRKNRGFGVDSNLKF